MMTSTASLARCCLSLLAAACLIPAAAGFVHPFRPAASAFQARAPRCNANLADDAAAVDDAEEENRSGTDDAKDAVAAVVGISGIAGAGATVASTVVTTAGGVCVGGGCVAGAGALAGGAAAGTGGSVAAAATGGGLLAGAKALIFGGALAAGVAFNDLLPGVSTAADSPTLEGMVLASTPLEVAVGNGRPTVMEFYGNACPHCHEAASRLRAVEETAVRSGGFNWVMVDTDDPRMVPLWMKYHVDEIPHFEFFDAEGGEVGYEVGEVEAQRIEDRMSQTIAHAPYTLGSLSTASIPPSQ